MEWIDLLSPCTTLPTGIPTTGTYRSEFERDVDRIIFSHPFRRLQDKTQVVPLPEHDFVHTRLTHSLEVSSVGRSLGKRVAVTLFARYPELQQKGLAPFDIGSAVAAACLSHDIGNPPFWAFGRTGHFRNFHAWAKNVRRRAVQSRRTGRFAEFRGQRPRIPPVGRQGKKRRT